MSGRCIHHLVEAQAALTANAVAVAWDGGTLTYRELDEQAGVLAGLLTAGGIRPERLVGVIMEPSPLLMVTMLAVWKAGGVYVPVDPSLPRGVAEGMLTDAGVALLVRNGPTNADPSDVPVLELDRLTLSGPAVGGPAVAVDPANLAYCVFTSGSTGKPKRVAVAHASFVNHAVSLRDRLRLGPADRVLQSTAIAFDAALEEILPAWAAGGAVVVPEQRQFTGRELTDMVDRLAVTMVSLPSAYWHQWVDDLTAGVVRLPKCLRVVFIGGDKILADKLAAWFRVPGTEAIDWVSDYGPTETTISVALHRPDGGDLNGAGDYALVPIGRPFAGAVIHVLDSDLRPVPDDAPGDLWIGGPPLARGYHAAPATTAERFLPDPYGPPGSRMYRTGDRGSRCPDGTLVFLGRSDRQVKIRGYRVEPGHVESAVLRCAGVRDAVVIDVDDPPFGSSLVAYIETEPDVSEAMVRADVAGRLPEFMVPQSILLLERIPRSPLNGKVTRAALPPVVTSAAAPAAAGAPATMTTLERVIATLVGDVLAGPPCGPDDDFFASGGDSLRAFQLLSRVAEVTGVALTYAQLRAAPHVAGIADLVRKEHRRGASDRAVLPAGERSDRRIASRGQQGLWFLDKVHRGAPTYATPLGYLICGPLDVDRLDTALTAIVARHESLRTVFELRDGKVWQRIQPAGTVRTAVTVVAGHDEASRRAAEESRRPFDLTAGPLVRSICFRFGAEQYLWLLNVHHAVFDAWSLGIFWRELATLYTGRPLPDPATQYADYAVWQERWLRSAEAEQQRAYWRTRLAGDLPTLELGSGGPAGTRGFAVELSPGAVDPAAVERVARECSATMFAVLLAAFFATLRRTASADEVVVGVPMACRHRPGTEDLIGYLMNTVPVRMRFPRGLSFRELIKRTDDELAEALAHQDLPLTDVMEVSTRRGGEPLFEAIFAMQSTPLDCYDDIDGLTITEQLVHQDTAKTTLMWTMRQNADGLAGEVEFAASRFDRTSARHWRDALLTLLAAGSADPGAPIDALPLTIAESVGSSG